MEQIINEDNAASYAVGLNNKLSRELTDPKNKSINDTSFVSFNRDRLEKGDGTVYDKAHFVEGVIAKLKSLNPIMCKRFERTIRLYAQEYCNACTERKSASVFTYFNY